MSNGSLNAECAFVHHLIKWQQYLEMQLPIQFSVAIKFTAIGNENPSTGLEREAIPPHFGNIQHSYESF
ncbi:hypothetical protein TNCV_4033551 [Trichonephila clavipes]|nr:hypothetical protein TNCV_4033551 [Trichonephila clavipes]